MGIWLRTGITLVEEHPVGGMQWPAASCRVRAGTSTFTVITGHVAPPWPADGRRWAEELAVLRQATEHTSGSRVVVANLNAKPWHADFRRFGASGIRDVADVLGQGPRPTWPTWSLIPLLPLDHIMVTGDVGVDTVHGVVIGGSDHRGLVATLRVPTG
jgi:endonuclease/exonuclease/phosphatase (EEP) superfamily protein YafD